MPVDLSTAGPPSAYPKHGLGFWPWLAIWAACIVPGSSLALLLWPKAEPARGAWFWFCIVGVPNGLFLLVRGIARAGYETFWFRAHFRNVHRTKWISTRVHLAQRPLHVLGVGYCLPLRDNSLAHVIAAGTSLLNMQRPRNGPGTILHNRFEEAETLAEDPGEAPTSADNETVASLSIAAPQTATIVAKLAQALEPLATSLHALSQYERRYWPQVRVLAAPGEALLREHQVREALRIAAIAPLECQAVPETDALLVADAWLDARERQPLLVVAVAWHDVAPPVGSTEGCVAVLLSPGFYELPEPVAPIGALHRPVADEFDKLESVLGNAVVWGRAHAPAIKHAWITGIGAEHDAALLAALRAASLQGVITHEAQSRLDRVVGDAGGANAWLSVAAAIESGVSGPQLIVDGAQAAILHVTRIANSN
ncbi:hypothetical protein [Burkholderia sp. WSM2230]|uniref:hypothetical protein n=1 Tax=Burkholderia sp. WSM2230 TaxID=944435 RepID=UPI0004717D99|nr:hypothetical protein [Burkholderia sp. WSM2230]